MAAITPELLKQKTKSLNKSSAAPTSPGIITGITQDALKQTTLKRTPPPKPPLNEDKPNAIQFPKLRPTGRLNTLVREDSESENKLPAEEQTSTTTEEPIAEKSAGPPLLKPKPSLKQKPIKKKPPPPPRRESLIVEDEEGTNDTRGESGDEAGSTSDHSESSVSSSRGSNALKPLPTLQRLGGPPPKKPITPDVRNEAMRFIASELAKRPELNNNIIEEEPCDELYDDVAVPGDETGEDLYDDVDSCMRTLTTNNEEPEELYGDVDGGQDANEELYDDVAVTTSLQNNQDNGVIQEELYNDVESAGQQEGGYPTSPGMDAGYNDEELYNDVETLPEPPEELYNDVEGGNVTEEFYDDVDAVLKDTPLRPGRVTGTIPTQPPMAENPIADENGGDDEYELLPNETPPLPTRPTEVPKKSKKELEKEEKARKKKEEQERKIRENIAKQEDELMKKAKVTRDADPIRVCVAKCNAKSSGKYALQITENEVLFVIKEEKGKCIVKNKADRIGYVDSKNIEDQVEEDSYECIESLREKLDIKL